MLYTLNGKNCIPQFSMNYLETPYIYTYSNANSNVEDWWFHFKLLHSWRGEKSFVGTGKLLFRRYTILIMIESMKVFNWVSGYECKFRVGGRHQFVYERITRFEENFVIEKWNLLPDQIKRNLYNFDSTTSPARFCRARELLVFSPGTGIQLRGNRGKSAKLNTSRKWVMTRGEVSENQFSTAKSITIKSTRRRL